MNIATFRQRDRLGWPRGLKCRKVDNSTHLKIVFVFPVGHRAAVLASGRLPNFDSALGQLSFEMPCSFAGPGAAAVYLLWNLRWLCSFTDEVLAQLNLLRNLFAPDLQERRLPPSRQNSVRKGGHCTFPRSTRSSLSLLRNQADYERSKVEGSFQAYNNDVCPLPSELDEKAPKLHLPTLKIPLLWHISRWRP